MVEHQSRDATLEQIERESERERAKLVETVLVLRDRLSPDAIKAEVTQSVRRTGRDLLSDVERRARENPLRAVAVATGVAYPAWRMLRSVPVPILLLGAGAALAGSRTPKGRTVQVVDASPTFAPPVRAAGSPVSTSAGAVEPMHPKGGQPVAAGGARLGANISETATSSYGPGVQATAQTGQGIASAGRAGLNEVVGAIERHPLVAGGLGALLGLALAVALPRSRAEDQLIGSASDQAKNRAAARVGAAAQEGLAAGERATGKVRREAEEQGLSPGGAKQAVREAGDRARNVVREAADAVEDGMTGSAGSKEEEPRSPAKDQTKK